MSENINENVEQKEFYELHVKPTFKMFYAEDSDYGIFSVEVSHKTEDAENIETNTYGNFTIKGSMPLLDETKQYVVKVKSKVAVDKLDRKSYDVVSIYEKMPTTKEEQEIFLRALLTEKQVNEIFAIYPDSDIIEMIAEDSFDYSQVKGLGEKTYQNVKKKVMENIEYREAIVKLSVGYGISHKTIRKMSDAYGSPTLLVQKIEEDPYILSYDVDGIGFKKADAIAIAHGVPNDSPKRMTACVLYTLEEESNNGHTWLSRNKMSALMAKELGLRMKMISEFLEEIPSNTKINSKVYIDDNCLALVKNRKAELSVSEHIKRLLEIENNYHITNIEARIDEAEEEQGFAFTDEQREAIELAVRKNVIIVNGKAGTGKTSVLKGLLKVLAQQELTYATCALSGKASQRIQESTGLISSTMHRLLGYVPNAGFQAHEESPLEQDIIVLDEASMVNSYLMSKLVCAVKDGAKLIILGDTAQLEPIGVGNCLLDLINSGEVPRVELTIVHRQAQKSGILSVANQVREGIQFAKKGDYSNKKLGELKDLWFYPYKDGDSVMKRVLKLAESYTGDIMDFQVIVPMKERGELCTRNLNEALQNIFNPDEIGKNNIVRGKVTFRQGDKVIQNGNNYDFGVFNGTIGIIEFIDMAKKIVVINFEGVGRIEYQQDDLGQIDLAYALTVHRTQGSQWKYVVFALDYSSYKLLSRQIVYTALTRASLHGFLVCELDALIHAVKTDNSTQRNTFLVDFLKGA